MWSTLRSLLGRRVSSAARFLAPHRNGRGFSRGSRHGFNVERLEQRELLSQAMILGSVLDYAAEPGETNNLVITRAGDVFTISDAADVSITAGSGCSGSGSPGAPVTCAATGVTRIDLDLGNRSDSANLSSLNTPASMRGGDGDDSLVGGSGNDTLTGGLGNDTLAGGGGVDRLVESGDVNFSLSFGFLAGLGIDSHSGFEDARLTGGTGDNLIAVVNFLGTAVLEGGDGNDVLSGDGLSETLIGGLGNDTLIGCAYSRFTDCDFQQADSLDGGIGDDFLLAGEGNDALDGGPGNDTLNGGSYGNDFLSGGDGDDTYLLSADWFLNRLGNDTIEDQSGNDLLQFFKYPITINLNLDDGEFQLVDSHGDTLSIHGTIENVIGTEYGDRIIGNAAHNRLDGGPGSVGDELTGGFGDDTLIGGDSGTDFVTETADGDFVLTNDRLTSPLGTDELIGIEAAHLTGGDGDNRLDASAFSGFENRVTLDGGAGDDTLIGANASDGTSFSDRTGDSLVGGPGNDFLQGSPRKDTIEGGAGRDTLIGGTGNDLLVGGLDDDRVTELGSVVFIGFGNSTFTLNNSRLIWAFETDMLVSIEEAELVGTNSSDTLDASAFTLGPVTLSGGNGNDTLRGGSGDDCLGGGQGEDSLTGGLGNDVLSGEDGFDSLAGGDGDDTLRGGAGRDQLDDNVGLNSLEGGPGCDRVNITFDFPECFREVMVSKVATVAGEDGTGDSYSMWLNSEPFENVTINIQAGFQVRVFPTQITFTRFNWMNPQPIQVSADNDHAAQGRRTSTISHSATSADETFRGISIPFVSVDITDNDTAQVLTHCDSQVAEGGAEGTCTVMLASEPLFNANVEVTLLPDNQLTFSPTVVNLGARNWNIPQFVRVRAIDDAAIESAHGGTVRFRSSSSDRNYDRGAIVGATILISDNDRDTVPPAVVQTPTCPPGAQIQSIRITFSEDVIGAEDWRNYSLTGRRNRSIQIVNPKYDSDTRTVTLTLKPPITARRLADYELIVFAGRGISDLQGNPLVGDVKGIHYKRRPPCLVARTPT